MRTLTLLFISNLFHFIYFSYTSFKLFCSIIPTLIYLTFAWQQKCNYSRVFIQYCNSLPMRPVYFPVLMPSHQFLGQLLLLHLSTFYLIANIFEYFSFSLPQSLSLGHASMKAVAQLERFICFNIMQVTAQPQPFPRRARPP